MNKAVLLDRDGTINIDYGFVHESDKLEFVPGVLEALSRIKEKGYILLIVTNQSGIGRGYFTWKTYQGFMDCFLERMKINKAAVEKVYTCPHISEDHCNCRKPKVGLYEEAIKDYDLDIGNSYVIGDRMRDLKVCEKYPFNGILFDPYLEVTNQDDAGKKDDIKTVYEIFHSWKEIADHICGE